MKLHHVGVVVESIEKAAIRYEQFFSLRPLTDVVTDNTQRVRVQFLGDHSSSTTLELVEPLGEKSPVRQALERGGGLNHLCFEVKDIEDSVRRAESSGAICVCQPVSAAAFDGRRVAFLVFGGIGVVEFVEAMAE